MYAWCPKHQHEVINPLVTAWKRKNLWSPLSRGNTFFLLRMRNLLFLLETSGSFCKFNSFLFLIFNLIFNFFKFIYSFPTTVSHLSYNTDLDPCDFWLFPKLRGCRYETIKEMKESGTKVIDTVTKEDFHGAFHKFLERYNKCIVAGGDNSEGD